MRSIPGLDGVRALAALFVVLTHVGFQSGFSRHGVGGAIAARGDIGVTLFFVLSGFLLTRAWLRSEPPRLTRYARVRAARILPAYWLALVAVLLLADPSPGGQTVTRNVLLVQAYWMDFIAGFTQTWSLTTEVAFYVLLPLLVVPLRSRWHWPWLALLGVSGLGCTAWAAQAHHGALAMSVAGHLAWFAAGLALAVVERELASGTAHPRVRRVTEVIRAESPMVLAAAATALLVAATPLAGPRGLEPVGPLTAVVKESLYLGIATTVVATAIWGDARAWPARILGSEPARWLGSISYGVFLWHLLLLEQVSRLLGIPLFGGSFLFLLGTTVALSVAVAWVSLVVVENPLRAWAHKTPRRAAEGGHHRELLQARR